MNTIEGMQQYYVIIEAAASSSYRITVQSDENEESGVGVDETSDPESSKKQIILIAAVAGGATTVIVLVLLGIWQHGKNRRDKTGLPESTDSKFVPVAVDQFAKTSRRASADRQWRLAVDPDSGSLYYYNERTRETSWEPPETMEGHPMSDATV